VNAIQQTYTRLWKAFGDAASGQSPGEPFSNTT